MSAKFNSWKALVAAGALVASVGCGNMATDSRSPVQLTILSLAGASGATPDEFGAILHSDVVTNGSFVNDNGSVEFGLVLKDPGNPTTPASPSALNSVTVTRYRVVYQRTDGRNTPGVDVPYAFDSAVTVTVSADGASTGFQLVRHSAKKEAPLQALANTPAVTISTVAEVTFYGRDQAGNDVSATGLIGVDFGNFADPQQ